MANLPKRHSDISWKIFDSPCSTHALRPSNFSTVTTRIKPSFFGLEACSKCSIFKQNSFQGEIDVAHLNFENNEIDSNLNNWERWLKIHKLQQDKLSAKLRRPPQCMVMNSNFNTLPVNQEKRIITEASSFEFCDKYRGPPNFWKTDDNMKNDGKSLGVYQTIQNKYSRSRQNTDKQQCSYPPELEYVGVPDVVFKEKGLSGMPCLPTPEIKWQKSTYAINKKELLKEKLEIFQRHKPESAHLAVVGEGLGDVESKKKCEKPHSEKYVLEKYISQNLTADSTGLEPMQVSKNSYMTVSIENQVIDEGSRNWTIFFDECFVSKTCEKYITIKNNDESSLRYWWEMILPYWAGHDWPVAQVRMRNKCFFFDKNDSVILPGKEKKLVFWFKSLVAGVFCEKWELILTNTPDQWESVIVELNAVAIESDVCRENLEKLDSYIESCTGCTIARKTAREVLDRSRPERPRELPYEWKFLEEQIFIHNNPDLYYDNKGVQLLKNLHEKISGSTWDYSVQSLRKELLQKHSDKDMTNELEMYSSTIYHLMKPTLTCPLTKEKFKSVYELLCCFVNKMECASSNLRLIYSVPLQLNESSEVFVAEVNTKSSIASTKFTGKASQSSRKALPRMKTSLGKSSIRTNKSLDEFLSKTNSSTEKSLQSLEIDENEFIRKKQEYLEAFYITTYDYLSRAVDQISIVIDTFDAQSKTVLNILKDCNK